MFNPSQQDSRRFFCEIYRKTLAREVLTPLESMTSHWIIQHPEYEKDLANLEAALEADYSVEQGKTNPFLHLAMHLGVTEQISIDQPAGIRALFNELAQREQSEHEAQHLIMECLALKMWEMQRHNKPFDSEGYIAAIETKLQQMKK
jgi:hypothetical protein